MCVSSSLRRGGGDAARMDSGRGSAHRRVKRGGDKSLLGKLESMLSRKKRSNDGLG